MTEEAKFVREPRIVTEHFRNAEGHPAGGYAEGPGLVVHWQNGPEKLTGHRGAFVEDLIDACISRLEFFQEGAHKCLENSVAIDCLQSALVSLESRTKDRLDRGVEGTYGQ